jgi:hypothetical protein
MSADDFEEMNRVCGRSLTHYMRPKAIVAIEEFPQTANGKLDRKALPDPVAEVMAVSIDSKMVCDGGSTLEGHVLNLVRRLRGVELKPTSTFGSIAVDSLGSVMFLRLLSEGLDGIPIRPVQLYSPGVSVRSFSIALYDWLKDNRSGVLLKLGISSAVGTFDVEAGSADAEPSDEDAYESVFSANLAANMRLINGVRG